MKTVFFGPFVGEFGWEILFWQGWVHRVCRDEFKAYRKIVSSYPGRQPLYPDADEFWPLTEDVLKLKPSGHNFFTDAWRGGHPGKQEWSYNWRSLAKALVYRRMPQKESWDRSVETPEIGPAVETMLESFKSKLPADTVYFVPWRKNTYAPQGIIFGVDIPEIPRLGTARPLRIPLEAQLIEPFMPTQEGLSAIENGLTQLGLDPKSRLLAVFPRRRLMRRPDRNWGQSSYEKLIEALRKEFPKHAIALLGEPNGAYFGDGVPKGCLDLIQVPTDKRVELHLAALSRSDIAMGTVSGALAFAHLAACPTLGWGYPETQENSHSCNYLGTPYIYHTDTQPTIEVVLSLTRSVLRMADWTRPTY